MVDVHQIYRSRVKNQDLFDKIFLFLKANKQGKVVNKGLVVKSTEAVVAFCHIEVGGMNINPMDGAELNNRCRSYAGNYNFTMFIND